jgi:hypothetical protein
MAKRYLFTSALAASLLGVALSSCAASPRPDASAPVATAPAADRQCDASTLGWAVGQVADDALVERARTEAGAQSVRVLRPGMMVTREFNGTRLNIRVDNERKVLATSCG